MAKGKLGILGALMHRRTMRRWEAIANRARSMRLSELRQARLHAAQQRAVLDRVLYIAGSRLKLPLIGSNAFQRPLNSDWAWRPELWRGPISPPGTAAADTKTTFGEEVTLFHDCRISELTVRQVRNSRETDLAPFGLKMDVFNFDGSFLSLVVELPADAVNGLQRKHLVRMTAAVDT